MVSRRMVLLGGLAATGGLVVGYALWPSDRLLRADKLLAGPGEHFVTAWLKIGKDGTVTAVIPHQDMGTGIFTALAQMAADELDADWSKVKTEQAPAETLFANGPLGEGMILWLEEISADTIPGFLRGLTANGFRMLAENMNLQITGGSTAVRTTGELGMRVSGAAARHVLIEAAAARWTVPSSSCTAKLSRIIHTPTGRSFGFGELAGEAAHYSAPGNPPLKARSDFTLIGKSVPRVDIPEKVNGTAVYGIDVTLPDMLYAAIAICPTFGGKLKSLDATATTDRRGIKKVIGLDDAVVVVADRFWRARDAVAALKPVWDLAGNEAVTSAALTESRTALLTSGEIKDTRKTGNGAAAITAKQIDAAYSVPYLAHATMEPMNATALWKKDGTLEVWSGVQDGLNARAFCAKTAGLKPEQVTMHVTKLGGGFGRRLPEAFNYLQYAVETAKTMPGVPVKLIFTREQDMQHGYYRPNVFSAFHGALDASGKPAAWVNTYTKNPPKSDFDKLGDPLAIRSAFIPYAIANQEYRTVYAPGTVPTGSWRSVENSWQGFFTESFIDELAHAAKADPAAYRKALLKDHPRHAAVLEKAAKEAGWGRPLPAGHALGVAVFESFKTIVAEVVEVSVTDSGQVNVHKVTAAVDAGTAVNPDGLKAQIEGGIIFALSAALNGEITLDKGAVVQANFPDYEMVRLLGCPEVAVHIIDSGAPLGGAGEPGVPPLAPALTNAIFAATGVRIRDLPVRNTELAAKSRKVSL